ncbi:DMT family transporter [Paracoccus contaminans]|uniref:Multidrug DMT transporter permease n=1 Tax=Paracoccus contaminans TaxID=1945662 RepID=A0A1W6CUF5_9RHOB|nr:DMT family transporter [Paracoccus contaminans]ARJ68465.1 multidrug DMT transporter permease [Paracoccus contaminans]
MMWIAASLIAALAQTGRNAAQAGLTGRLGTVGATGVRFLFGLPFALIFLAVLSRRDGLPPLAASAIVWTAAGALAQVGATALMLRAMQLRGFAVATALIKTEPVTLALLGALVLGEPLGPARMGAISLATAGVLLMAGTDWRGAGWRALLTAVAAGALFGASAIGFRGAILSLQGGGHVGRATMVLALSLAMQTALVGGWLALTDRPVLRAMAGAWRESLGAGFLGALASQFWFIGFALAPAADVRTLALAEVAFAALVSRRRRERIGPRMLAGIVLVMAGVAWLLRAG